MTSMLGEISNAMNRAVRTKFREKRSNCGNQFEFHFFNVYSYDLKCLDYSAIGFLDFIQ